MSHDYEKVDQDTEREIDKSVMKELKRENAELMAMVNELREVVCDAAAWVEDKMLQGDIVDSLVSFAIKTPPQSLHDHDMRIAEAVRDRLFSKLFYGIKGCCNHSCIIEKPNGMGTNGPCHCLHDRTKANIIASRLAALRNIDITELLKNA